MIREIGSEFWLSCDSVARQDSSNTRFLLSGRSALDYIIRDIKVEQKLESVYMPSYCCKSMLEPFVRNGVNIRFYDVYSGEDSFQLVYESDNHCDAVLLLDYFGYKNVGLPTITERAKAAGKAVIYDATHKLNDSVVTTQNADYSFCSFRKWFYSNAAAVWKNGKFSIEKPLNRNLRYEALRNEAAQKKRDFMTGLVDDKEQYLKLFYEAEETLNHAYVGYTAEPASIDWLSYVDVDKIAKKRRKNAQTIIDGLKGSKLVQPIFNTIGGSDVPLFVPVIVSGSKCDTLKKYLIDNKIYCPVHWPLSELHKITDEAKKVYQSELSLICDQRYSETDMQHQLNMIKRFELENA